MRKAVIDMGTNSTRLAVGSLQDGTLKIEFTQVLETRLGEGMGTERIIKPEPLQRNVDAVRQFVQQAEAMGVESLRITATSAVRDAANKEQVQQAIEAAAGMELEILPGETEARLSYLGASGDFLNLRRPLAVLDMTQAQREQIPGMKAKRADIMPYGVLILQQAMELLQMPEVIISDKGLVYGLLLEAFGVGI